MRRVRAYLVDKRAFEDEAARLVHEEGYRLHGVLTASPRLRSILRDLHAAMLRRHAAESYEILFGFSSPSDVDWNSTEVISVVIRGRKATVTTIEPAQGPPPQRFEYLLTNEGSDWRIMDRRIRNDDPPPQWISHLL